MACSPGGPASRSTACGLRLVCDRDRGADLPVDPPVWADRTSLLEVGLPRRPSAWSRPSLSVGGTSLHGLQASQPFPLVPVIKVRRAAPRELLRAHGEEEGSGRGGAQKVFDSQRAGGYSPLDFPLFGGLRWASWRRSETGEEQCMQSLVRGGARGLATDQMGRDEIPGNAWRCNQSREDVDRKVRTEP